MTESLSMIAYPTVSGNLCRLPPLWEMPVLPGPSATSPAYANLAAATAVVPGAEMGPSTWR